MNTEYLKIINYFKSLKKTNILVIGDVMLDTYMSGKISRISPEGPIPVFNYKTQNDYLGGAANVAMNLKSIGANVTLCGTIGNDLNGNKIL